LKKLLGWSGVVGGLLWGLKPIYDMSIHNRRWGQGYEPTHFLDYIAFLFPLLCIGGLIVIYGFYKKAVRNSIIFLIVAVILNAGFTFSETYFYGSGLPFGLIFMLTGLLSTMIGTIYFVLQLKRASDSNLLLSGGAITLFLVNFLLVAFGFLSDVFPKDLVDFISETLFVSVGFIWSLFGASALILTNKNASNRKYLAL